MTVREVLSNLPSTRSVVLTDLEVRPIEEGIAGGLLDESFYLDSPVVYTENIFRILSLLVFPSRRFYG